MAELDDLLNSDAPDTVTPAGPNPTIAQTSAAPVPQAAQQQEWKAEDAVTVTPEPAAPEKPALQAAEPAKDSGPDIPDALKAQWEALTQKAALADRFAPIVERYEKSGLTDAAAVQAQEAKVKQEADLTAHFEAKRNELWQQALAQVSPEIDELGLDPETADSLKNRQAFALMEAEATRYENTTRSNIAQQEQGRIQAERDIHDYCNRKEYLVDGQPLPETMFRGIAVGILHANPQASYESIAKETQQEYQAICTREHTRAVATLAKQNSAQKSPPVNGAVSPGAPPARDWKNPSGNRTLSYEILHGT